MARVLVTGGAGFIGSHLVEALVERGDRVRVFDNLSSGSLGNLKKVSDQIEFVEGDVRDRQKVKEVMQGIEFVLHQAALRSVPKSIKEPEDYHDVNVNGTWNLLFAAHQMKVKRFVFASSSSVYGDVAEFPQREGSEAEPISPYALSKLMGEAYCRLFSRIFDLPTVSLRYFNIYGPRQAVDDEYSAVIPKFISCLLNGESPPIYGDGEQSRDFTYIRNVVDANLAAMTHGGGKGEVINVACGKTVSILKLARRIGEVLQSSVTPCHLPPREGDVRKSHADITNLEKILGIVPRISFEEGLRETVHWFCEKRAHT